MPDKSFAIFFSELSPEEKQELARKAGTTVKTLYQYANERRMVGQSLGARLKKADKRLTDAMLRPDLYGRTS